MSKFQRTYTMKVQGRSGNVYAISDPLTVVFDVSRRAFGSLNTGHFTVYNLSQSVRNDIRYDNAIDAERRTFSFSAGYKSEGYEPVIFQGTLQRALVYRDGPNVATEIQVLDGGQAVQNAQLELSRAHPWDAAVEMANIIGLMSKYGVKLGAVGSLFKNFKSTRGTTWIGSVWDVLKKKAAASGGYACIDLEKAYLMAQNDALVIPGALPQLDASTGLIGTPRRSGWVVDANMIFEPRVQLMQALKCLSLINPDITGTFSVQAIGHRGTISGAVDGGCETSLSLYSSPVGLNMVVPK